MTVIELLTDALTIAGVIGTGQNVTDAHTTNAFRSLIGLTDTMSADPLKKLTLARLRFLLQPGKQAYTIGADSSLDIKASRPQKILRGNGVYLSAGPNPFHYTIKVFTNDQYARTVQRDSPISMPDAVWYDSGYSAIPAPADGPPANTDAPVLGYGTINFVGMPTDPNAIELWAEAPLTQASSVFDDLVFPPAYYEYLLYGTVMRLYPRYTREPAQLVIDLFKAAQLALESANAQPAPVMLLDSGLPNATGAQWDARTNRYIS